MSHQGTAAEATHSQTGVADTRVGAEDLPGALASGLYVGRVRHRRFEPVCNQFTYSGFWLYLDLAEIDDVFRGRWLWSCSRPALMRFRREDHLLFPDDVFGADADSQSLSCALSDGEVRVGGEGEGVAGQTSAELPPPDSAFGQLLSPEEQRKRDARPAEVEDQKTRSFGVSPQRRTGETLPPLEQSVRSLVEFSTGRRPRGPIRLLTQVRCFGYLMNPVSFFYCFDECGERLETVVAEVNNTPWGERHCYVLDAAGLAGSRSSTQETDGRLAENEQAGSPDSALLPQFESVPRFESVRSDSRRIESSHLRFEHRKRFHVSPFMEMNMSYRWRISQPGENLSVQIENWQHGDGGLAERPMFDVTFHLNRRPMTGGQLARMLMRHPFMTGKFVAAIYWQALKLWWKRCPFVPHPNSKSQEASES